MAQTVATYGSLHVLFNNAGGGTRGVFPAEANEAWEGVLKLNLTGTFLMCRAAWPHLIAAGGGAIIHMVLALQALVVSYLRQITR